MKDCYDNVEKAREAMKTAFANEIETSNNKRKYDAQCKKTLANKYVLANILKDTVEEVQDKDINEIISCIDNNFDVGNIGILEQTDKIEESNTVDGSVSEGTIYYDIRFSVYIAGNDKIKILFDVEAQKDYYPGYNIVTRGIVYGARMISSQIGKEFDLKHYDAVKKVYSIWICFGAPKKVGNAISRYAIRKEDIVPGIPDIRTAYDELVVIMICLDEKKQSRSRAINLLNTLFSETKSAEEIKNELLHKYDIPMDDGYGREIDVMCNLSGKVYEKGLLDALFGLVKDNVLSIEVAASRVPMPESEFVERMKDWENANIGE